MTALAQAKDEEVDTDRFRVSMDNTVDRSVFRYSFLDHGVAIESGSAPHPRIVGQRFDAFKAQRRWADGGG